MFLERKGKEIKDSILNKQNTKTWTFYVKKTLNLNPEFYFKIFFSRYTIFQTCHNFMKCYWATEIIFLLIIKKKPQSVFSEIANYP